MPSIIRSLFTLVIFMLSGLGDGALLFAQEQAPRDDLAQHIANMKAQSEDVSLPIGQREKFLLNAAESLDRAAQRSTSLEEKQKRWTQAIELLDQFNASNSGHPRMDEFSLQAAVYRWAQGQSQREASRRNPTDQKSSQQASAILDDAINRFRAIPRGNLEKSIEDNLRFRLARAIADRAELEPLGSGTRQAREEESLQIIKDPVSAPGLKGFAGLLRAELLRKAKRPDEALAELAAAAKAEPPPPDREIYEALVPILLDQGRFTEAATAVKDSRLEPFAKSLDLFRIALARVLRTPQGDERLALEKDLFQQANELRGSGHAETRLALLALASSGLEPDARLDSIAWDIMAEAADLAGNAEKAGALALRAATRAVELGQSEAAVGYRLRAGGFLFQAGQFTEADELLTKIVNDPVGGASRVKAGMLRGLARGRALAAGAPGVTPASYAQALQEQIRDFPKERATDEARWLLASMLRVSGEAPKALKLWAEIPSGSNRWLDAQLAIFEVKRVELEHLLFTGDRQTQIHEYQKIQEELKTVQSQVRGVHEETELGIAEARLNLLPGVGKPRVAKENCERLAERSITAIQRYRLRLLRMIALIHLGPPFIEAERDAQSHATWAEPSAHSPFFDAVRLLDLCAATSDADLRQRRFGLVSRILLRATLPEGESSSWSPDELSELRIRLARACIFLGDERGAREALRGWTGPPRNASDDLLRDIADMYSRLEAYKMAIDVQRMRSKNLTPGSAPWFEARYGLALAYFHAGQFSSAAQLIDATAILHPELGGGNIQKKLVRLRQRLGEKP